MSGPIRLGFVLSDEVSDSDPPGGDGLLRGQRPPCGSRAAQKAPVSQPPLEPKLRTAWRGARLDPLGSFYFLPRWKSKIGAR